MLAAASARRFPDLLVDSRPPSCQATVNREVKAPRFVTRTEPDAALDNAGGL